MADFLTHILTYKSFLIPLWLIILIFMENSFPAASIPLSIAGYGRSFWKRWGRNFGLAGINIILSRFVVVPVTLFAGTYPFWDRPQTEWYIILLDIIVLDFWIYWWHRANHEVPFLWRFHQIHHRDEFLDASSALRFHWGEVTLSAIVRGLVIMLLAIPVSTVFLFEILVLVSALLQHSNWRLNSSIEKYMMKIVVTPGFHWLHHHAQREDTDSNYGTIFSFWDNIFKSRNRKKRDPLMVIGMPGGKELPFWKLLKRPFVS